MGNFNIRILGCGSALPTTRHYSSSQVIDLRGKLYMIDCGEGTQIQFRRMRLRFNRLSHIFISHLHGDHCFGLPGLISTLGMLGRTGDLCVYGPKGTDEYLEPILDRFCAGLGFKVKIITFDASKHAMLMDDSSVSVYTIPLQHRIPAAGFLFAEKPTSPHLIREMLDFYRVPVKCMASIKQGNDYVTEDGEVVPNNRLTRPATPPKKYAYCSDTSFLPEIVPLITGVDLLYHEATFMEADGVRAGETNHSTAVQAAEIARMANVKKLMLGHFSARYEDESMIRDEAMKVFPNVILADEGFQVDV